MISRCLHSQAFYVCATLTTASELLWHLWLGTNHRTILSQSASVSTETCKAVQSSIVAASLEWTIMPIGAGNGMALHSLQCCASRYYIRNVVVKSYRKLLTSPGFKPHLLISPTAPPSLPYPSLGTHTPRCFDLCSKRTGRLHLLCSSLSQLRKPIISFSLSRHCLSKSSQINRIFRSSTLPGQEWPKHS